MRQRFLLWLIHQLCLLYIHTEGDEDKWVIPIMLGDMTEEQGETYKPGNYLKR